MAVVDFVVLLRRVIFVVVLYLCVISISPMFDYVVSLSDDSNSNNKGQQQQQQDCVESRDNLVVGGSNPEIPHEVVITRLEGTVYKANGKPSCYKREPTIPMPGILRLLHGELIVPRHYDFVQSGVLKLTIRSPKMSDALCLRGASQYMALPNSICSVNLCEFIGIELCRLLQTPGKHTIKELEEKVRFNSTLLLPEPPSFLGISLLDIFSGDFGFAFVLEVDKRAIMEFSVPINHEFLKIGLEESEPDD